MFFSQKTGRGKKRRTTHIVLNNRDKYNVKTMCHVLKVSESGYYRWLKNRGKPPARELLSVEIKKILDDDPGNDNYGVKRMNTALEQKGIHVSQRTVYRAMSEMGILHQKKTPHGITRATAEIQNRENLIKRDFTAKEPLKKLLSDITKIQCSNGKLYLSAVFDCCNGEILSAVMDDNMKKELCIRNVRELVLQYGKKLNGAIFYSDRESQYTNAAFRNSLRMIRLVQSLSGTGHRFDNARMESFLTTLKKGSPHTNYRVNVSKALSFTTYSFTTIESA